MGNTETPRRERDAGCGAGRAAAFIALAGGSDRYKGPGRADEDRGRKRPGVVCAAAPAQAPARQSQDVVLIQDEPTHPRMQPRKSERVLIAPRHMEAQFRHSAWQKEL